MIWLRRYWHHVLFASITAGVLGLTSLLVWAGLDPAWQPHLAKFPPVVGALLGPFLGLTAILLGALYNAKLNRDRDDRQRGEEARALMTALHAELQAAALSVSRLEWQVEGLGRAVAASNRNEMRKKIAAAQPDLPEPSFKVFEENLDRLGLISPRILTNLIMTIDVARSAVAPFKNPEMVSSLVRIQPKLESCARSLLEVAGRLGNEVGIATMTYEYLKSTMDEISAAGSTDT